MLTTSQKNLSLVRDFLMESAQKTVEAYVRKYAPKHVFEVAGVQYEKLPAASTVSAWGTLTGQEGYRIRYDNRDVQFEEHYHFTSRRGDEDMFTDVSLRVGDAWILRPKT
jgi:hypothetical protein